MTMVLWFLSALAVLALGYAYFGWRLIASFQFSTAGNVAAWSALGVLFCLTVATVVLEINRVKNMCANVLVWAGYIMLGLLSLTMTLLLLRDVLWLTVAGARGAFTLVGQLLGAGHHSLAPADHDRRTLLVQAMDLGILATAGALTAYGVFEARRRPAIVEVEVPIDGLHGDLEGFRIVQITDLHVGLTVTRSFVETVVEMANALKGDVITFTRDLVDGSVENLREHVAPMAGLSAPHGRFFVTGNHEYYSGAEQWVEEARRLGFDVLTNEYRLLTQGRGTIVLAGVPDASAGQFVPTHASDPRKALTNAPAADVTILLAHQPRSLHQAAKAGVDLQISGHTHGGQFFPWNLVATIGQPFIAGLHRFQKTWIYVSRGTGYLGPPVRLAARSEITWFTLTSSHH